MHPKTRCDYSASIPQAVSSISSLLRRSIHHCLERIICQFTQPLRLPILEVAAVSNSLSAMGMHSGTRIGGVILPLRAPTCKSKNSISFSTKVPVGLSKASILLCPAPSTQKGLALHGCGNDMNRSSPCQKGTTSSCVP